jgi:hypothetical protein
MKPSTIAFAFLLAVGVGCSSSTTSTVTDAGSEHADGGAHEGGTGTAVDSGSGSAEASTAKPATPTVASVEPLTGGLHVTWKLNDTGLTAVELWRKKDSGAYAKAYTLPGTATSQHDEAAMAPGMYCYQVMTIRGSDMSDMSPEKCGTP